MSGPLDGPVVACIWAVIRDINGNCPSRRSEISPQANLHSSESGPSHASQRCSLSANLNLDQHASGKAPGAHWPPTGVCRRLESPQWPVPAGMRCPMQRQKL